MENQDIIFSKMEEFSDVTNISIILILFFFFYLYLNYMKIKLLLKKNIDKVKCNPLDMVIVGMFNEEDATKTFKNCLENSTIGNMYETRQIINNDYDKYINKFNYHADKQDQDVNQIKANYNEELEIQQELLGEQTQYALDMSNILQDSKIILDNYKDTHNDYQTLIESSKHKDVD